MESTYVYARLPSS